MNVSVQPTWCLALPIQQQSVLFLAGRGPDGIAKSHPCKPVQIAYRASVFVAAKYGRCLEWGERADSFMSLDVFANDRAWYETTLAFFTHVDDLPHHYLLHLPLAFIKSKQEPLFSPRGPNFSALSRTRARARSSSACLTWPCKCSCHVDRSRKPKPAPGA